jgi:hypothetical protein
MYERNMEHGVCTAKEPGTQVVLYIYMYTVHLLYIVKKIGK